MLFFVLQSVKSHMFSNFKDMSAVVFKNFLKMIESEKTKLLTFVNKFESFG
jgi:hypothetical protein